MNVDDPDTVSKVRLVHLSFGRRRRYRAAVVIPTEQRVEQTLLVEMTDVFPNKRFKIVCSLDHVALPETRVKTRPEKAFLDDLHFRSRLWISHLRL